MKVSGAVAMADHVEAFGCTDEHLIQIGKCWTKFDADPFTPSEAKLERAAEAIYDMRFSDLDMEKAREMARAVVEALNAP